MVKNGCGQSDYRTPKLTVSPECTDGASRFINAGANSGKLKFAPMIFWWAWSKMGMTFSLRNLKICFIVRMSL